MIHFLKHIYAPEFNFLKPSYWFGQLDTRPLSLFRIIFALGMLKVVAYYWFIAELFFSDEGLVPRSVIWEVGRKTRFSLLDTFGETWQVQAFVVIWMIVLFNLLIGYHTRWMTILNFIFIVSMHERNTYVLNGADTVLRILSFWCMVIPLSQYYSVDAVRQRWRTYQTTRNASDLRVEESPRTGYAFPIRFIQIQVAFIYLFTFLLKLPGKPWQEGSALHYALQVQSLMLPTGDWVLANTPYPVLQVLSYGTMFFEGTFFIFVFLPLFQPFLRAASLWMGIMMHTGIAVLMAIPNFSTIMITSYLTLCLPQWVEGWDSWLRAKRQALVLPLPLPNSPLWVLAAITKGEEIALDLAPTPDSDHQGEGYDDWVVWGRDGQRYTGRAAWRQALAHIPLSKLWLWLLRIPYLRRLIWWSASWQTTSPVNIPASCGERTPPVQWELLRFTGRTALTVALLWVMLGIVWWNLYTIKTDNGKHRLVDPMSDTARSAMQYMGIWQSWGMFSPYPTVNDGWITVPAYFEDGQQIDLMTGQPVTMEWQHWYWGPERWKKFTSNMRATGPDEIFEAWGRYYCRRYNIGQNLPEGKRLAHFEIVINSQRSYAPGDDPNPVRARVLWKHWCFPEYRY